MTRLAVVVGSVRPNRVGGTIAQWVVDQANKIEGVEAEIVDIASFNLPLFAEEEIRRAETTTRLARLPEDVVDEVFEHVRGTHGVDQGRAALARLGHVA